MPPIGGQRTVVCGTQDYGFTAFGPNMEKHDTVAALGLSSCLSRRGCVHQLGKVCLVGCESMLTDLARRTVRIGAHTLVKGERLTLDGDTVAILGGAARTVQEAPRELLLRLAALRAPAQADAQCA